MTRPARNPAAGQALGLALLVLFLASLAASLLAADLSLRQRERLAAAADFNLRSLLDGGLADALARLAENPTAGGRTLALGAGEVTSTIRRLPDDSRLVRVDASWRSRRAAAEARVLLPPLGPPRVVAWRAVPFPR